MSEIYHKHCDWYTFRRWIWWYHVHARTHPIKLAFQMRRTCSTAFRLQRKTLKARCARRNSRLFADAVAWEPKEHIHHFRSLFLSSNASSHSYRFHFLPLADLRILQFAWSHILRHFPPKAGDQQTLIKREYPTILDYVNFIHSAIDYYKNQFIFIEFHKVLVHINLVHCSFPYYFFFA